MRTLCSATCCSRSATTFPTWRAVREYAPGSIGGAYVHARSAMMIRYLTLGMALARWPNFFPWVEWWVLTWLGIPIRIFKILGPFFNGNSIDKVNSTTKTLSQKSLAQWLGNLFLSPHWPYSTWPHLREKGGGNFWWQVQRNKLCIALLLFSHSCFSSFQQDKITLTMMILQSKWTWMLLYFFPKGSIVTVASLISW